MVIFLASAARLGELGAGNERSGIMPKKQKGRPSAK